MSDKTKAIQLAEKHDVIKTWLETNHEVWAIDAAKELRRLDEENISLRAQVSRTNRELEIAHDQLSLLTGAQPASNPVGTLFNGEFVYINHDFDSVPNRHYKLYTAPQQAPTGEELQKLLNNAYAKGRDDANAARDLMAQQAPVDERDLPNVVRTAPKDIFLCLGEDDDDDVLNADFKTLEEVSWSDDKPVPHVIKYTRAALKPAVPDGWQLVPKKVNDEMVAAFNDAFEQTDDGYGVRPDAEWKAMLAAAPQPAQGKE
ncbi:hypothetical protein [Chitinibacter sp. GC72]|uniref:hypothetical protein n=1 Tax=Chitinibacter sp. GC72 TaxID=1526917 RepID=UPI0012F8DF8A|nr:hypothetical protein [Chitinibacter sp. GC72]